MKLGIDMDGVLAQFDASFSRLLIATTGRNLFPTLPYDPPCWDWITPLGYTKDEESATWDAVKRSPTFWSSLPAYPDAECALVQLRDRAHNGDEVYFITNRMGNNPKKQTEVWLSNHGYLGATVMICARKGQCAAALELDAYIDDKPENCDDVIKAMGLKCRTFVMDRSWNQSYRRSYVQRVTSIDEMLKEIRGTVTA